MSDRWFDYESPLDAKFSSITTSALVDEVKSLLVSEGNARPMPKMPAKSHIPPKPVRPTDPHSGLKSIFSQSPLETSQPSRPDAPKNPVEDVPSFEAKTYWQNLSNNLWRSVLIITICMAGLNWIFPSTMANNFASVASIFSFVPEDHPYRQTAITSFSFQIPLVSEWVIQQAFVDRTIRQISMFSLLLLYLALRLMVAPFEARKKEKERVEAHDQKIKSAEEKYEILRSEYEKKLTDWENEVANHEKAIQKFEAQQVVYQTELKSFEGELQVYNADIERINSKFNTVLRDYNSEVAEVNSFRSELWDRTRVCTRCACVYLGPRMKIVS